MKDGGGKLFGNVHLLDENGEGLDLGVMRKRKRGSRKVVVGNIYQQQKDLDLEMIMSHGLKDKTVVVEPNHPAEKKRKIERLVFKHGGKVEQNYKSGKTDLYIETGMKIKAKNILALKSVDIVSSKWILSQVFVIYLISATFIYNYIENFPRRPLTTSSYLVLMSMSS